MWKITSSVLLIITTLSPSLALAGEDFPERIERFLNILESNPKYYLNNDYDLYGEGEMIIDEKLCGGSTERPINEMTLCANLAIARRQDNSTTPSLFLLWLRTKLPPKPTVIILKTEWVPRYSRHIITAKLNNIIVIFNLYNEGSAYQPMEVKSINENAIFDLLNQDIQQGLSISELLEASTN